MVWERGGKRGRGQGVSDQWLESVLLPYLELWLGQGVLRLPWDVMEQQN